MLVVRRALVSLFAAVLLIGGVSIASGQRPGMGPRPGGGPGGSTRGPSGPPVTLSFQWIDVHVHLAGDRSDFRGAIAAAVAAMDESGISTMVLMSPPNVSGGRLWDVDDVLPVLSPRARFGVLGGGGTLNPMIHDTKPEAVDDAVRRRFEAQAEAIIKKGAAGFGEIAAHHLSHMPGHPYESVDADHPLLLLLADVAARHDAVIDLHFDMVAEDMKAPEWVNIPPTPPVLRANLAGFERLLAHNRGARIVWAHAGSDQLGWWTADLSRRLLTTHPNLYMSSGWRRDARHRTAPSGSTASCGPSGWHCSRHSPTASCWAATSSSCRRRCGARGRASVLRSGRR